MHEARSRCRPTIATGPEPLCGVPGRRIQRRDNPETPRRSFPDGRASCPARGSASVIRHSRSRAALRPAHCRAGAAHAEPRAADRRYERACFHFTARSAVKPTGGWSDVRSNNRRPGRGGNLRRPVRRLPAHRPAGRRGGCRRRRHRRREGAHAAFAGGPRAAVEGRRVRRDLDRLRRLALRRGLRQLAADPHAVHRPAGGPAGGDAADAGRGGGAAVAARSGRRPAELVPQRHAPALAGRRSGSRTRSSTSSTCSSGRTRSPARRSCRSTRTARTPSPSTRPATPTRPGPSGRCRRARSTASTGPSRGR